MEKNQIKRRASSRTSAPLCSKMCKGWVFVRLSAGQETDRVAPCPCNLIFGPNREGVAWWPPAAWTDSPKKSALQMWNAQKGSPLAFFRSEPRPNEPVDPFVELCALAYLLISLAPSSTQRIGQKALYGHLDVELAPHHCKALEQVAELRKQWGLRESVDHHLLSCAELRDWQTKKLISEIRPQLLVIPREEFQFMASSTSRLKLFEEFIQFLSVQDLPLILFAENSLFSPQSLEPQSPHGRTSARNVEGRLRFRSSKKREASSMVQSFEDLLSPDLFDRILIALESGRLTLARWQLAAEIASHKSLSNADFPGTRP